MRDVGPLILSLLASSMALFSLGILLIPDWAPEVIPLLAAASLVLTLVGQAAAVRNALSRRELAWLPVIVLTGPLGVLAYSLSRATRGGELDAALTDLARQTVGKEQE